MHESAGRSQYSISTDAKLRGAPVGRRLDVREVRLAAGAGLVVMICGEIMTMPGLPRAPAAERLDLDAAGQIGGLSWPRCRPWGCSGCNAH